MEEEEQNYCTITDITEIITLFMYVVCVSLMFAIYKIIQIFHDFYKNMPDRVEEAAKVAVEWFIQFVKDLPSKLIGLIGDLFKGILDNVLGPIKKLIPSTEGIKNATGSVVKVVENVSKPVANVAKSIINKIKFW